ncbi:hypothetical protein SKAU_G00170480 [Synaphobranchus kaupii]|uniref:Interleukin family protein n=1 Tax=Synaphobranchus kaupii TaxID=118154 RepID=A0A9Q1FKJ6_SYNKA|nr:hypothetical protein SKAU_G00170480 [Synaphobranchus kaupii]
MSLSWFFQLSLLLTALLLEPAHCRKDCKDKCCSFLDNFSVRLKELRTSFAKIKDYYEDKDDIPTALLDENVLNDFQSPFGCHAMKEVLRFYLDTVLPTAMNEKANKDYIHPIGSISDIFYELKKEVIHCVSNP